MSYGRQLCTAVIWLVAFSVTPSLVPQRFPSPSLVEAAGPSVPILHAQSRKGFVTAKAERSLTIQDGGSTVQVAVTEKTQVMGLRGSFGPVAMGDLVRVEGTMTADRLLQAARIEVLVAANTMMVGQRAATGPANTLLSLIVNGGITVPLR